MATKYTYPGVYVEEVPSGERTITGVSTSVTAFVGYTQKGPVNKAVRLYNFGDFERNFGGLSVDSEVGYQLRQYFLNGGTEALVVRVAKDAAKAAVRLNNGTSGVVSNVLEVQAASEGAWGNFVRLDVDYAASNPDGEFNLTVTEYKQQGSSLVASRSEVHRNLSMNSKSDTYAISVVNTASQLVKLTRLAVPAAVTGAKGYSLSGRITAATIGELDDETRAFSVTIDGVGPQTIEIYAAGATPPADHDELVDQMETALQAKFPGVTVERANALGAVNAAGEYLLIKSATTGEFSAVQIKNAATANAAAKLKLGLSAGGREQAAAALMRPAQTGLVSGDLADVDLSTINAAGQITVAVGTSVMALGSGSTANIGAVTSLNELRQVLQDRVQQIGGGTNPTLKAVTVQLTGTRLRIYSGTDTSDATITITDAANALGTALKLTAATATSSNVQRYALGGKSVAAQVEVAGGIGNDGTPPGATELQGTLSAKTGIYALEDVDIFNLMCIPRVAQLTGASAETEALNLISAAVAYAAQRRAFLIVDPPSTLTSVTGAQTWANSKVGRDKNAALYFPWVQVADPMDGYRLKAIPPSGTIAGLYARTDSTRGIWKAPAGTEATLKGVQELAYNLTDAENGTLNQIAVNCLRNFPVYGRVSWGARTLDGADEMASEWKYVPVRRLALYIEESLFRGLKWVVFEPNDEPLWAQIRLNAGSFMHRLFRQGAFQGSSPKQAYFVKCDAETTTADDINQGIVNILVGFAPLKPAEFVVIKLQQIAAQAQS